MPSCLLCGRSRISKNKHLGISFHRIPKKEINRSQWLDFIQKCGVDHLKIKPKSIICSEHFSKNCFKNYKRTKLLHETAVPSIIILRIKSAKTKVSEVENDSILREGVESINSVSVEEPSNSSNVIFTDCNQITCEPSTPFLKKSLTQKVNSEVVKEIKHDKKKNNLILTISSLMRENCNQRKKINDLNQRLKRQKIQISALKGVVEVLKNKT